MSVATPPMTSEAQRLLARLDELGVPSRLVGEVVAPQLVRYEVEPADPKLKMRDYRKLDRASDLAFSLGAESVRIQAPMPGRSVVGIEVARKDRDWVALDELPNAHKPLLVNLGLTVEGRPAILPLTDAPHVLCAGQTGAGKSSMIHTILAQLVASHTPQELQMILIDVKRVELTRWESAPHLAAPVADDPLEAIRQLRGAVLTMERRYETLKALGARDIFEANKILAADGHKTIPHALIVVDELAELIMTSAKEVESLLIRLAQKGRAAGIVLIVATQYPVASVLTGLLRVNIPTKLCFAVPDMTASRVVIDRNGAQELLGKGDGLLSLAGLPPERFQAAFVTQEEVAAIIKEARKK